MKSLLAEIARCTVCAAHLPHGVRPVMAAGPTAKILIVGQAPGRRVHETGIPWNDPSGINLRKWMGIGPEIFYDVDWVALMPMGFCYPGTGRSGDLAPRSECAPLWHQRLLDKMESIKVTLLVGSYAQDYYLRDQAGTNLTETVRRYREFQPAVFPLPHPSPRNQIWQKRNPWFANELLPDLQTVVRSVLNETRR